MGLAVPARKPFAPNSPLDTMPRAVTHILTASREAVKSA